MFQCEQVMMFLLYLSHLRLSQNKNRESDVTSAPAEKLAETLLKTVKGVGFLH